MKIRHLKPFDTTDLRAMEEAFAAIEPQPIACCNWPDTYPYRPQVSFRIFHTGETLWLRFDVEERYTKGEVTEDNGRVWTDSCVEFFITLDDTGYYNFETTCTGRLLLAFRKEREHPTHATPELLARVGRYPSLGREPFAERVGDNRWSTVLAIPADVLFRHQLKRWNGVQATANLYKCGDELSHPHFLSWQPIENPKPDFHLPRFFAEVEFEQ